MTSQELNAAWAKCEQAIYDAINEAEAHDPESVAEVVFKATIQIERARCLKIAVKNRDCDYATHREDYQQAARHIADAIEKGADPK